MAKPKYKFSLTDKGREKYEKRDFRLVVKPIAKELFCILYPDISLTNPEIAKQIGIETMDANGITSTYSRKGYLKKEKNLDRMKKK